jgi:hypothetical protein
MNVVVGGERGRGRRGRFEAAGGGRLSPHEMGLTRPPADRSTSDAEKAQSHMRHVPGVTEGQHGDAPHEREVTVAACDLGKAPAGRRGGRARGRCRQLVGPSEVVSGAT